MQNYELEETCASTPTPSGENTVEWYRTSVALGPSLQVLLDRIDADVRAARAAGRLAEQAQIYAFSTGSVMQLFVNEAARLSMPSVNLLALLPGSKPEPSHAQPLIQP